MNWAGIHHSTTEGLNDQSATQRAYRALRTDIILGKIPPNQKLKIEDLRQKLDFGASPIREALSLLTSDQLVVRQDQRGFRSAAISRENFREILDLRTTLEQKAIRLSIANSNTEWEEQLILSYHRLARSKGIDPLLAEDLHKSFHMSLLKNCGSPLLLQYCDQLYDLNIRYRFQAAAKSEYQAREVATEHQEILEATIDLDADLASDRLREHYARTGQYLSTLIGD